MVRQHRRRQIAGILSLEGIPYLALDIEPDHVRTASRDGYNVLYGDATHRDILQAVGLDRAGAVVISFSDDQTAALVANNIRSLRHRLPVLVRGAEEDNWRGTK